MVIFKQFIVLLLLLLSFLKNIVYLVNCYELREVEETVNVCIHRSKGYSSLYLEEVSEQIKIRQEIFKKCVQLRNQPFRYGKPNFEFSNEKARWVSSALEVRKCPHPTSLKFDIGFLITVGINEFNDVRRVREKKAFILALLN